MEPRLRAELGIGFDGLERADMAAFFRAPSLDGLFPAEQLMPTFEATLAGLGQNRRPGNVIVDAEPRPKKPPRAFCAPVRVPEEVYLVLTRIGGREDYETLMHEAGHAEHFSTSIPRYRSSTATWAKLRDRGFRVPVPAPDGGPRVARTPAGDRGPGGRRGASACLKARLPPALLREIAYELELHGDGGVDGLDELYARRLSDAVHVDWPKTGWLSDVDPFFYVAAYLRAWALETHLRRELRERFGELRVEDPGAGDLLRELWSAGQRERGDELPRRLTGAQLDFSALLD